MDGITELLNNFDLAEILPHITDFISDLRFWICVAVLLGPLLLLGFGAWYYLAPPQKANHMIGCRVYYGMGSDRAWKFTQRLAGIVWGGLGAVLTVVMALVCIICAGVSPVDFGLTAVICVIIEVVLVLAGYIAIQVIVRKSFDKDGRKR